MLGAITGDIAGSIYEFHPIKHKNFELFSPKSHFTDDSVLTVAIAKSIIDNESYLKNIVEFALKYPNAGYGGYFIRWVFGSEHKPYNSWGNGSAMRVSPIGFAFDSKEQVLEEAKKSAEITHNHPEGIKGAQAVALAIYLARNKATKEQIRKEVSEEFGYDLNRSVDEIRPTYKFEVSCQKSVPESIISFLDATSFEDAIKNAISLGGDADTMGAIAGSIAEAYYGIPESIKKQTLSYLPLEFIEIIDRFYAYLRAK